MCRTSNRPDARFNFTSFVVLLANIVYWPQHDLVEQDRRLIREAINLTEKHLDNYEGLAKFKQLQCVIDNLERLADLTVIHSRQHDGYQLATDVEALASDKSLHLPNNPTVQFGNSNSSSGAGGGIVSSGDLDDIFVSEKQPLFPFLYLRP